MEDDINIKEEKRRTIAQNNALHLFYEHVAQVLRENGMGIKQVLERFNLDAPATKYGIKEYLWRPLQFSMFGKKSTTELLKQQEIDQIYDALNKFFVEKLELQLPPFPSIESLSLEEEFKNRKYQ